MIQSLVDVALGVAAQVTNVGLCFACMAVAGCLAAFAFVMVGQ